MHRQLNGILLVATIAQVLLFASTESRTIRHTFRVSYISGYPDGVRTSHILAINGQFPGPLIQAEVGDILEIRIVNNIQDGQNVTMHWHGLHQRGTPFQDGPADITQCPIKNGQSQLYKFPLPESGTYWYHSHVNSQYTEGLWGVLIIRDKPETYSDLYDAEMLITLNDWYHASAHDNEAFLLSPSSRGAAPFPSSALMNGRGRYNCIYAYRQRRLCSSLLQRRPVFRVQPGKTYRIRLVSTAGWTSFNFTVTGHTLRVIEVDGVHTKISSPVHAVHIGAGQRYSFLLSIPKSGRPGSRYLIRAGMRTDLLFTRPGNINRFPEAVTKEVTGILVYSNQKYQETTELFPWFKRYTIGESDRWSNLKFLNEAALQNYDHHTAPDYFNTSLHLNITFQYDSQGIRRGSFNGRPVRLTMAQPALAMMVKNQTIPESLFPVGIGFGQVVQVVVNNPLEGPHPIHLHGHHFWLMGMGAAGDGNYTVGKHSLSLGNLMRDTGLVKEKSWMVLRFTADNVGVWTLHCHVDWHMLTGMSMTFIEAPELAHTLQIPQEARRVCADHNIEI